MITLIIAALLWLQPDPTFPCTYEGEALNQEECEALFGGPGWD